MSAVTGVRRLPVGAEALRDGGVSFRVWAPLRKSVGVLIEGRDFKLNKEPEGYFSGVVENASHGTLYKLRVDGGDAFPDPASRFQPEGPHGPSMVVDPSTFPWTDHDWKGLPLRGQVIYEMHVGTFTPEGTWQAAAEELAELARIGVSIIELMPVADFSGKFGWGYDGVNWFAPTRLYGSPDDFRSFVDRAHSHGIAVLLDVVYNHFGSDGNYAPQICPYYLSKTRKTDWGEALNYDGENSEGVREYVRTNATYWIAEYHLDGLRLDATQDVYDTSSVHILTEITQAVRDAGEGRSTIVIAENEPQETKLVRPRSKGGYEMDGLWNDDFHHSAIVALTGSRDAYYTDYMGSAQEFVSALKYGYLYQGQWYRWQGNRRGSPSYGISPEAFVTFIQNHDQVANSARGQRVHELTSPGLYRAMTAVMLLGPGTPMLFQGQEFAASSPFLFFADMPEGIREAVKRGRRGFLAQWRSLRLPEMESVFANPCSPETFERCKLDLSERQRHAPSYKLHSDLIRLRRSDPVLRDPVSFDGAVLSPRSFCFRYFGAGQDDRLLIVNLDSTLEFNPAPEPLLGPPFGKEWHVVFSTEHPDYGGLGTAPLDSDQNWIIPPQSAVLLAPAEAGSSPQLPPKETFQ